MIFKKYQYSSLLSWRIAVSSMYNTLVIFVRKEHSVREIAFFSFHAYKFVKFNVSKIRLNAMNYRSFSHCLLQSGHEFRVKQWNLSIPLVWGFRREHRAAPPAVNHAMNYKTVANRECSEFHDGTENFESTAYETEVPSVALHTVDFILRHIAF